MSETRYTLTVTEDQACAISAACELLARLGMGQLDDALRFMPAPQDRDWQAFHDACRVATDAMQPVIRNKAGNLPRRHEQSAIAWDLYQVLRHRLAWDRAYERGVVKPGDSRKWPAMLGVCYDEPLPMAEHPLATIVRNT